MPDTGGGGPLLVVDVLNAYDHEDAERLALSAAATVPRAAELLETAREAGRRILYVNDNDGDWSAGRQELVRAALAGRHPELVEPLIPHEGEGFLVKGRHSAFWQTQLEFVLRSGGDEEFTVIGQATEQCVLYTVIDAYIRSFTVTVFPDACARIDEELAAAAVAMMRRNLSVRIG